MSAPRPSWMARACAALVASLREAAARFPESGEDGATSVHDARKAFKRAASIARLFAPIMGGPAYEAIDAVDAARPAPHVPASGLRGGPAAGGCGEPAAGGCGQGEADAHAAAGAAWEPPAL